jgi:hypothetical protein
MRVRVFTVILAAAAIAGVSCSRASRPSAPPGDAVVEPSREGASADAVQATSVDAGLVVLPRREDACSSDAECGATELDLSGPTVCCFRCCSVHGGRKPWIESVEATCRAASKAACRDSACACPMPPFVPKCIEGRCGLVYPERDAR